MMRRVVICTSFVVLALGFAGCDAQRTLDRAVEEVASQAVHLSVEELLAWPAYGRGAVEGYRNQALILREEPGSVGVMIVSPDAYSESVVIRFRAFTLRPATVLVAILSASDVDGAEGLPLPATYDGSIRPWLGPIESYFLAFHNAAHLRYPFVNRVSADGAVILDEAGRSWMHSGRWYEVEAGRDGGEVWLSIDGERVLHAIDDQPLGPGRLAIRVRGTGPEVASAMIRDVRVLEP